jgi:uncharacterized membrane protein
MSKKFSIGGVFSRTFGILGENPALILGLWAITSALPVVIMQVVLYQQFGIVVSNPGTDPTATMTQLPLILGYGLLAGLLSYISLSVITELAVLKSVGKPFILNDAIGRGLKNIIPLFVIALLTALAIGLGFVLLIIPGIILALLFCVVSPVYVSEGGVGIFGAFTRSRALTKGHRWTLLLLFILAGIAYYILAIIVTGVTLPLILAGSMAILGTVLSALGTSLLSVIGIVFIAALYVALREDKEGHTADVASQVF